MIKYKEIVLETDNKFYTITYTNQEKNFDSNLTTFNNILDSFETSSKPKTESQVINLPPQVNTGINNITIGIAVGIGAAISIVIVVFVKRKKKSVKR